MVRLRLPSHWVLVAALGVLFTGCASASSESDALVSGPPTTKPSLSATAEPTVPEDISESPSSSASASRPPGPTTGPGQVVTVTDVIDGDTIDTTAGRVRVIGIDTPERGECNFGPATSQLRSDIASYGNTVVLVPVADRDDTDRYGRLLRYIDAPDGTDLGRNLLLSGLAIARYDSRDGYGRHPRQDDYVAVDEAVPQIPCGGA